MKNVIIMIIKEKKRKNAFQINSIENEERKR